MDIQKIIQEELIDVILENITKNFAKAVEAYREIQLKQQQLRKKFVSEKDPKKKEKLKDALIKLHKKVQKAESDFNNALRNEPVEDDLMEKSKGLWANIHAKRKRGGKPARKGSKAYKKAKKAADNINKSEGLTEARLSSQQNKALDNMNDWLPKGKEEEYLEILNQERTPAMIKFLSRNADLGVLYKKYKVRGKRDMAALASELMNEGKLNEDVFKAFVDDLKQDPRSKRGYVATATNTEKRKSVKARKTNKTWDDGVPVLKYISRASKKDSPLPKGKFKVVVDDGYGWWYYKVGNNWYGIQQKDYGTPPFEY